MNQLSLVEPVGSTQIIDLAVASLDAKCSDRNNAGTKTAVDFVALNPLEQGLRYATDLRCDRLDRRPQ